MNLGQIKNWRVSLVVAYIYLNERGKQRTGKSCISYHIIVDWLWPDSLFFRYYLQAQYFWSFGRGRMLCWRTSGMLSTMKPMNQTDQKPLKRLGYFLNILVEFELSAALNLVYLINRLVLK